ncbi:uncharacterized protein LOC124405144 isoform X2 [Diprion similis]|nr:uncharacterized protein LOC124405144 isoform X2 [Diprion similis]XP_046735763.1 uncharacterized protein LOC124405144 isoform X2 [Diprion similis]
MGSAIISQSSNLTLFDFTSSDNVSDWTEQSDTVRTVGKSKAVIVIQETQVFRRAVFFTLLNPQSNGAGFAGVRTETTLNLTGYNNIDINCRGQGNNTGYKVVLRHKGQDNEPYPTYEQFFTAPMSTEEFSTVSLPLTNFTAYYRGKVVPDADALDVTNITSFGLQVYGGVYQTVHQSGVSSLEINTIVATS